MDAIDRSAVAGTKSAIRKTWATPVVIVESTSRDTNSIQNSLGPDATTSGDPVGS